MLLNWAEKMNNFSAVWKFSKCVRVEAMKGEADKPKQHQKIFFGPKLCCFRNC
jgi:hypothetical protein